MDAAFTESADNGRLILTYRALRQEVQTLLGPEMFRTDIKRMVERKKVFSFYGKRLSVSCQ